MKRLTLILSSLLAAVPVLAFGAEATGVLHISLTVVASCNVQTQPVAFTPYVTGGAASSTATGAIDVRCTSGTPAAVFLDGDRTLEGPGGNRVAYTLRANGKAWPADQSIPVVGQGRQPVHLELAGSVPGGQQVAIGEYAANEVVRVVY
jgi:spore coat protein U-like protein